MAYRLLLMDDSVTIRRVIELTFAGGDVEVTTVGDGRAAMERIQADPPDIVLADAGTAKPDGYEVAAFVKNNAALAHIPVLLLSGAFQPIDQSRARDARCDGVLAKPFELQSVIARVKALLEHADTGTQNPSVAADSNGLPGEPVAEPAASGGPATEEAQALPLRDYLGWLEELLGENPPGEHSNNGSCGTEEDAAGFPSLSLDLDAGTALPQPPAGCTLDEYFDLVDEVFARDRTKTP